MLWINFSNFVNMLKYKCGKIEINFTKLYMNVLDDVIKFVWFFFSICTNKSISCFG